MSTADGLLIDMVGQLKTENARLQERIKTVEATNRELRKECSKVQMEIYNLNDEVKTARMNRDDYERMTSFIKLFKETFKLADEDHNHDGKYKSDYD